jgi:hypothetical protein
VRGTLDHLLDLRMRERLAFRRARDHLLLHLRQRAGRDEQVKFNPDPPGRGSSTSALPPVATKFGFAPKCRDAQSRTYVDLSNATIVCGLIL